MISACKRIYIEKCNPQWYEEKLRELIKRAPAETVICSSCFEFDLSRKGYRISAEADGLRVCAEGGEMLFQAYSKIVKMMCAEEIYTLTEAEETFVFPKREDYVRDASLFTPVWRYTWQPPEWLLSYDEKVRSFPQANRPMCWAHRGGGTYYPENSAEAILSSVYMGADIMELDFRYTADGRIVLMHYDTLHQSTDWEQKKGTNGLPESDFLADWTYEQLCRLRLKAGRYFDPEAITEYQIPTLEDVLQICNGRAFFIMDKMDPAAEWEKIYDCIRKTECYEAFAFAYKMPEETVRKLRTEMLARFGKTGPYFYWRKHAGSLERECLSTDERLQVFKEFSQGKNTAIMTNYVRELIEYIDSHYRPNTEIAEKGRFVG